MVENTIKHTCLIVKEKKNLSLDGVENVEGFDSSYVSLATAAGRITVEGEELKIESLTKEKGEIHVSGRIIGVYYSEIKKQKGLFSKLFG